MPRLSGDGKWVAWLQPVNGVLQAWVAPSQSPQAARPITHEGSRGVQNTAWAGGRFVYAKDALGDEDWHLWSVNPDGSDPKDLTPIPGVSATVVGNSPVHPGVLLVGLNDREPALHDVWRIDAHTGERTLVLMNEGEAGFIVDRELTVRASVTMSPDGSLRWELRHGAERASWFEVPAADSLTTQVVGIEGRIAWILDSRGRDTAALVEENLDTGERRVLVAATDSDVQEVWKHPMSGVPQMAFTEGERRKPWSLDSRAGNDMNWLHTQLPDADLHLVSRTDDDLTWLVTEERSDGPLRHWTFHRKTQALELLFNSRPWLDTAPLALMRAVTIPARDGLPLVSYLTLPRWVGDRPAAPLPLVLNVHGGPWARDHWGYDPEAQLFANRGYAVLSVNFRGSTGLGKGFLNAGDLEWAGRMHDDLLDAADWAVEQGIADRARVAVVGGSYGGYAALVALTFTPGRFACGVSLVGPSNLLTLLASIPAYWAPMRAMFTTRMGDDQTEEGRALLWERSPLARVAEIRDPLLIAQGANDPRVRQQESEQIVQAMRERKIPFTYALFPDEGHGLARAENRLAYYALAQNFLALHLGGRTEPGLPGGSSVILETY